MQSTTCAECLRAMSRGKSELLARIACANCQQAKADLEHAHDLCEIPSGSVLGSRCSLCGKWFLTKTGYSLTGETTLLRSFRRPPQNLRR